MNKTISKSTAIITIILAVLVIGGVLTYQYYWPTSEKKTETPIEEVIENKKVRLVSFEIIPSCEISDRNITYPVGAKMVAKGENLADVRFFISPAGSNLKSKESLATKNGDQWEAVLTDSGIFFPDIVAIGYDFEDNEVDRIKLGKIVSGPGASGGGPGSYPQYPQDCKNNIY